jgi:hypothetical protein
MRQCSIAASPRESDPEERVDFGLGERANHTRAKRSQMDGPEADPDESRYLEPRRLREPSRLAFSSLPEVDDDHAAATIDPLVLHEHRRDVHAFHLGPLGKTAERGRIGHGCHPEPVAADQSRPGMQECFREVTIIGEKEKTFRLVVEATDRVEAADACPERVEDGRLPSLAPSAHEKPGGLVVREIAVGFGKVDRRSVERHAVVRGIDIDAHAVRRRSVHEHAPVPDPAVGLAAGATRAASEELVKPHPRGSSLPRRGPPPSRAIPAIPHSPPARG